MARFSWCYLFRGELLYFYHDSASQGAQTEFTCLGYTPVGVIHSSGVQSFTSYSCTEKCWVAWEHNHPREYSNIELLRSTYLTLFTVPNCGWSNISIGFVCHSLWSIESWPTNIAAVIGSYMIFDFSVKKLFKHNFPSSVPLWIVRSIILLWDSHLSPVVGKEQRLCSTSHLGRR